MATTPATHFAVDAARRFSESRIWDLQRRYFHERGIEAWNSGEVPHYITNNPTIASAYAEIVFANRRDQERLNPAGAEPFTIIELGAGSGRFAFYFRRRLDALCAEHEIPSTAFRYILTDAATANIEFWRSHPRLKPYFEKGLLDVARFDLVRDTTVDPILGGDSIEPGTLRRPIAVIANYVFDSLPQDLLCFSSGEVGEGWAALGADIDPAGAKPADLLKHLTVEYSWQRRRGSYPEPWLEALVAGYAAALDKTCLLFPAAALRGLDRLSRLSRQGLVLLSADKGEHRLDQLYGRPPPELTRHGSFSLNVNYHAVRMWCERRGGRARFMPHGYAGINVACAAVLPEAGDYTETDRAYERTVATFGPDEFFTIMQHLRVTFTKLSATDLVAYLRLSRHDPFQFERVAPWLTVLAPSFTPDEHESVLEALDRAWSQYFPIGEKTDLRTRVLSLLEAMNESDRAGRYSEVPEGLPIPGPQRRRRAASDQSRSRPVAAC